MRRWWRITALLLLPLLAGSGCRTQKAAISTEYRYIVQRDSIVTEKWDTVRVEVRGDTVRVFEKLHEREYYSTIYRDTLRRCDTLMIERHTIERQERKKAKWWAWMLAGSLLTIIGGIVLKIILKIYIKK